eukprot:CAMPEP_0117615578 /NCGR_PEP_ID=MMETSP0784-20121206/84611_1 /TAXON_ID=39447 /ORGANISM="" /LENGTH=403 /DNA_ID=CAMNT_0005419317 /DNA_START=30 /DNA_END=1241 /DNA_ORIENTATION=+
MRLPGCEEKEDGPLPVAELRTELKSFSTPGEALSYSVVSDMWEWGAPVRMQSKAGDYMLDVAINKDRPQFQILANGRWEQRIHPSEPECTEPATCNIQGPHKRGGGFNWVIAWGKSGTKARITLVAPDGELETVRWEPLDAQQSVQSDPSNAPRATALPSDAFTVMPKPGGGACPAPMRTTSPRKGPPSGERGLTERRQGQWLDRHSLTFKNEEVSRLDRSYFDRWREPEALLAARKSHSGSRESTLVWSLERSGSVHSDASTVIAHSDARNKGYGTWYPNHHKFFANESKSCRLNPNLRSYFDRFREPADAVGSPLPSQSERECREDLDPHARARMPTESALRRRRAKLVEDQKLPVVWNLGEKKKKEDSLTLRENKSDGSLLARKQQKRCDGWCFRHSVLF